MAVPSKPKPIKLFVCAFTSKQELFDLIKKDLEALYGEIDVQSKLYDFNHTKYYEKEMGQNLFKVFYSFKKLISPSELYKIKLKTNEIEESYALKDNDIPRPINLDPGYLDLSKIILATTKNFSHRIYLNEGIYAEVTLKYSHGQYIPFEWTFPDYGSGIYNEFFITTRGKLTKAYKE